MISRLCGEVARATRRVEYRVLSSLGSASRAEPSRGIFGVKTHSEYVRVDWRGLAASAADLEKDDDDALELLMGPS